VRRCAADIGHTPSPDEFAKWANGDNLKGRRFCLFGREISPPAAKLMFDQPGRLVTVSPEGMARISKANGGKTLPVAAFILHSFLLFLIPMCRSSGYTDKEAVR
jgi:hypothetical protein